MIHVGERHRTHPVEEDGSVSHAPRAERVIAYLARKGRPFRVLSHPEAATAIDEAGELHVFADEVLKSLLVRTRHGAVLVVVPASRRVDMNLLRDAVGDPEARLATEGEIEILYPWCELGSLPALGSLLEIPMILDTELMEQDELVFAAGSRTSSIEMRTDDLLEGEPFSVAPLVIHPWWADTPI